MRYSITHGRFCGFEAHCQATNILRKIMPAGLFCALFLLAGCQYLPGKKESEPRISKNPCIVLALPESGPYAPISAKIKRGANLAKQQLQASGTQVVVQDINTQQSDWLAKLAALPPQCAVVGGPLQEKSYQAARKSGALEQRAFFSFTPAIEKGDEGRNAWRFFPSPQDQIDALVKFATDDMNIRTYGAFYPADNYGRRMTQLLQDTLSGKHISLEKAAYNPSAPATWSDSVAPLINAKKIENVNTPVPQTTFEALFVPDSWKNMDMITTSLLYNGEDRLALLGTTLWEQGLGGKQIPKAERYALAVFPGAWNSARAPKNLQSGSNDFWVALGYDFINFAVNMGMEARLTAQEITDRAQRASSMVRAMAPLSFSRDGIASQRLYLFQVTPQGMKPLDEARFRQARSAAMEKAALRMQGFGNIDPDSGEVIPQSVTEAGELPSNAEQDAGQLPARDAREQISTDYGQPSPVSREAPMPSVATQPAGTFSNTPQPSYKLRLPSKRTR